jgi:hypothetical protein
VRKVPKKESKWRIAAAIVAGYAALGLLAVLTEWILGFIAPEIHTSREMPTYYFVVVGTTDAFFSVVGGYVCAKVALTAFRQATIGLIVVGELIALVAAVQAWYTAPRVYLISLLLVYPPLAWAGSWLRVRQVPVKPLMVRASA